MQVRHLTKPLSGAVGPPVNEAPSYTYAVTIHLRAKLAFPGLPCMEIKGLDGSLYSVLSPNPPTHGGGPGLHVAVGCGSSYGIGQLLNPKRAVGDWLGTDTQFGHPPPPERLVREERCHDGGDAGAQGRARSSSATVVYRGLDPLEEPVVRHVFHPDDRIR